MEEIVSNAFLVFKTQGYGDDFIWYTKVVPEDSIRYSLYMKCLRRQVYGKRTGNTIEEDEASVTYDLLGDFSQEDLDNIRQELERGGWSKWNL